MNVSLNPLATQCVPKERAAWPVQARRPSWSPTSAAARPRRPLVDHGTTSPTHADEDRKPIHHAVYGVRDVAQISGASPHSGPIVRHLRGAPQAPMMRLHQKRPPRRAAPSGSRS